MKTVCKVFLFAAGFALAVLAGCDTSTGSNPEESFVPQTGTFEVNRQTGDKAVYYSLSTGQWVTDPVAIASKAWDIGFVRPRVILTNSGDTAVDVGSNGQGSVWYTTKADEFDDVVLGDQVTDNTTVPSIYNVDTKKYVSSANAGLRIQNVMNFPGYEFGDGSQENPFKTLQYNMKQFYRMGEDEASGGYPATGTVYIIRHGDGEHYSKVQVTFYRYASSTDYWTVQYETLN